MNWAIGWQYRIPGVITTSPIQLTELHLQQPTFHVQHTLARPLSVLQMQNPQVRCSLFHKLNAAFFACPTKIFQQATK